jgi:creatinine amidohydrolase/Fe(II)-dependent formamide hydrolase-like protein
MDKARAPRFNGADKGVRMQLHLSSWPEIDAYLARAKGIIIPIGSTEQHGPNGLIGTDVICPEAIAKAAGEADGILVGPAFNVGCAQHHLGFAGTMTLRPSTMIAALFDWVTSLARHGFTQFYFLNGHGGNCATINAAFSEIYADRSLAGDGGNKPALRCTLRNWWEFREILDLCRKLYPEGHGSHATPSEVALTYFVHPEAIKHVAMSPKIAPTGPIIDAEDYRRRFPDGRIGSDPSLAKPEDGATLIEAAISCVRRDYASFIAAR